MPLSNYSEELQQRIKQAKTVNERSKIIRDSDEHKQRVATQGTRMAAAAKQRKANIEQQRRDEATQRMNRFVEETKKLTPQQLAVEQKKGNAILAQRALEKKADAAAYAKQHSAFEAQKNKEDAASAAAMKAKNLATARAAGIPDSPDVYKKGGSVKRMAEGGAANKRYDELMAKRKIDNAAVRAKGGVDTGAAYDPAKDRYSDQNIAARKQAEANRTPEQLKAIREASLGRTENTYRKLGVPQKIIQNTMSLERQARQGMYDRLDAKKAAQKKSMGMAKGGSASSRADGCAVRGKTRA